MKSSLSCYSISLNVAKLVLLLNLVFVSVSAQNASVEQSFYGLEAGFSGFWLHNESKINNDWAIRSEIGLNLWFSENTSNKIDFVFLMPSVSIEPRWYYNLNRRTEKSKMIQGNSGNFVSLKTSFHSDLFHIPNKKEIDNLSAFSFVPTWGLRRVLWKNFHFELGLGLGYMHYLEQPSIEIKEVIFYNDIKISYRF